MHFLDGAVWTTPITRLLAKSKVSLSLVNSVEGFMHMHSMDCSP